MRQWRFTHTARGKFWAPDETMEVYSHSKGQVLGTKFRCTHTARGKFS